MPRSYFFLIVVLIIRMLTRLLILIKVKLYLVVILAIQMIRVSPIFKAIVKLNLHVELSNSVE